VATTSRLKRVTVAAAVIALVAGCSPGGGSAGRGLRVVAAENFWGSIAAQLVGANAHVQSILVNPAEDPHSYEPTSADAVRLATARLAIVNGVDYDPWASKLLGANPASGRIVLTVGDLFGLKEGDNPHRWYDPAEVQQVGRAITADLSRLDPKHAAYFRRQLVHFDTVDLRRYHAVITAIRARYGGVPVGASESIFALQAPALGLKLVTPSSFMKATSEGTEPTAQDIATIEHQISSGQIKVWIYNSQNATPQIQRFNALARAHGIPITTVTETLSPASDSFEQWQVSQLQRLELALHRATGH
jgi:zinc/manganese transport system substrate-binding protein